jgi:hypothetical protein
MFLISNNTFTEILVQCSVSVSVPGFLVAWALKGKKWVGYFFAELFPCASLNFSPHHVYSGELTVLRVTI